MVKWYTLQTQNLLSVRTCGFKSHLGYYPLFNKGKVDDDGGYMFKHRVNYLDGTFEIKVSSSSALNVLKEQGAYYNARTKQILTKPACGSKSLQKQIAIAYGIPISNRNILRGRVDVPTNGTVIDMTEKTLRHALDI